MPLLEDFRTSTFTSKVENFPEESYSLDKHSHLSKLLNVVLGTAGVGHLSRQQLLARLSESIPGTRFYDLDSLYGEFLQFPRHKEEKYPYNPFFDSLTTSEWDEVQAKDGYYRERISKFMRAISLGATIQGLQLVAESVLGVPCQVYERWRQLDGIDLSSLSWSLSAGENPYKQFLVTAKGEISIHKKRVLFSVMNRVKPVDAVFQFYAIPTSEFIPLDIRSATSSSEFSFLIRRVYPSMVANGIESFISTTEIAEVPLTAFMRVQESEVILNNSVNLSTSPLNYLKGSDTGVWGSYLSIPLSNSPDNYPSGKYGDEKFSWDSQAQWVVVFTEQVERLGGEVLGERYRLPIVTGQQTESQQLLDVGLSEDVSSVRSSWYGEA